MNVKCTICDAVVSSRAARDRCPECGARAEFQVTTIEAPRHARQIGAGEERRAWDFDPSGPVLRRMR